MTHSLDMDAARELAEAAKKAAATCMSFGEVCDVILEDVYKMPEYYQRWIDILENPLDCLSICPQCKRRLLEEEAVKMAKGEYDKTGS